MERTDVLCPRVGLEILQDHGFYNQSRFWLFFLPARFCRRRRGRRKRRSIRRERRWRWCHRLIFFFFNLRHLSSCSLFLQQRNKCISLIILWNEVSNLWEKRKQKKFCSCVWLGLQFSKFSNLSLLSLSSSLFIFELARALKKRY